MPTDQQPNISDATEPKGAGVADEQATEPVVDTTTPAEDQWESYGQLLASIDWSKVGEAGQRMFVLGLNWSRQRADIAKEKALGEQAAREAQERLKLEKQIQEQKADAARNEFDLAKAKWESDKEHARNEFDLARARWQSDKEHAHDVNELERDRERLSAQLRYSNDRVRGLVLYLVVLALVATPLVAMGWFDISAQEFAQFVAPITGIAGTVLGYWFGRKDPSG